MPIKRAEGSEGHKNEALDKGQYGKFQCPSKGQKGLKEKKNEEIEKGFTTIRFNAHQKGRRV